MKTHTNFNDVFGLNGNILYMLIVHMPSRPTFDVLEWLVYHELVNHLSSGVDDIVLKGDIWCSVK